VRSGEGACVALIAALAVVGTHAAAQVPTATPTPGLVHINVGSETGRPADAVDITVYLVAFGTGVAATANDITFNKVALSIDPAACRINPAIGKTVLASVLKEDRSTRTLRIFVLSTGDTSPIPDGPLYTCAVRIAATATPRTYTLTNRNTIAFRPDATSLPHVDGLGGFVIVSLVVGPSATPTTTPTPSPTATATSTGSATPTPTVALCPRGLTLVPDTAAPGTEVHLSGRCASIRGGRAAAVLFGDTPVATVTGDVMGSYEADFTVPDALPGTYVVRVVGFRQIASSDFTVTGGACAGDCDGGGRVTTNELITALNIALGRTPSAACTAADVSRDAAVSATELVTAVRDAAGRCAETK